MNPDWGFVLCDKTRLHLFPAIGELGRMLAGLPDLQSFTGARFRRRDLSNLTIVIRDDAGGPLRLGALSERMLWFLHWRALRAANSRLVLADSELAAALWPGQDRQRPAHWRADLAAILGSLGRLHLFLKGSEVDLLEPATALLASATDLRSEPERDRCPEGCSARGTGSHHHYLVQLGSLFLGCLEGCRTEREEHQQFAYDFHNRRLLRRLGRQNCLASVFLPAKLGSPTRTQTLSASQHRILQGLVQEITRVPARRRDQPVQCQVVAGGIVPDYRGVQTFCPLLPRMPELIVFGGNGHRRGFGYQVASPVGWCAKTGFAIERPGEFLQELLSLSELLGLHLVGATSLSVGWLSGAELLRLAEARGGRTNLRHVHLRVYAAADCWARWAEYFAWEVRPPSAGALDALRIRLAASGGSQREWAQRLNLDPSRLSRYLSGQRRIPEEIMARMEALCATQLGRVGEEQGD